MKRETTAAKMAKLLGLEHKVPEKLKPQTEKKKNYGFVPVNEDELQHFRAAQGLYYFFQAPELFTAKICKHCGESFLVSRKFVAFCSYTCIEKDLESIGIKWRKGQDFEALALDPEVYAGNEPIWVRNLDRIQDLLDSLDAERAKATL